MHIVVVGNGVAGMEAALSLRSADESLELTVVSEESDNFFSRTALMWVLCGQLNHADIEPYERGLYERARLRRIRARAVGLDARGKRLLLAGNRTALSYDRLLIACGSRPRRPPWPNADLRGIGHFVTMQDLEWLEQELYAGPGQGRPPRPDQHLGATTDDSPYLPRAPAATLRSRLAGEPAVIGGGLIGIEAVEVFVAAGRRPRFFIREEWFWPIALDAREAAWVAQRLRSHGVDVLLDHEITGFEGDEQGTVRCVRTASGEHACDVVVVAIGVEPNTGWLADSGLELDELGGIVVGDDLRTCLPSVFAAGDCASVRWEDGTRRPEQLWYTARDQGRVAARALMGEPVRYDRGTWYNAAKLMDIEYTTVGQVNRRLSGEQNWFHEEMGAVRSTTRIVSMADRIVGFNALGRRWDHDLVARWIEERRTLPWVIAHLSEASFDSELVPPPQLPHTNV
ncbi:MAG: NAD(P)/FAD-dependent oxidoreductase [Proteobacteria bacterium]|nr:NAD(P)/FAD-dependent oxidoreductase [Pseudomonadota bacterium]